ncbi:hypothetical protein ZOD2009_22147 [Haladaptatus paucihalophilus DX253]|uniref:Uncharacterized protein n=1 Tax=Haladaptatus paucihalophilus DX253 TaxID=797209 RepID=E7R035_HALPU|nr:MULTISPECIES: hypothetical protein [Haladaptatus]EFW89929.1 hypothetical protein ZOD2009_22147 [Haladaptatus paucihalophilus DX253]GKZ12944.1 hypothetical protein HAL_08250 [Haladaptatus sp. T7]SHK58489.1 hypothetical protein SAMN05444342_1758 [Haladaptatus paucihalophilus DX253]
MGGDLLIDLDEESWIALAKYNLLLTTLFGLLTLGTKYAWGSDALLLVENGALTLVFGSVQTYCWLVAPRA